METLGVIPARGGSKGITKKNLVSVRGKPLIAYTCETALASTRLPKVILSTDDDEIAEVVSQFGIEVPFRRPSELAGDEVPMVSILQHVVEWAEEEHHVPDVVVLLQIRNLVPIPEARHVFGPPCQSGLEPSPRTAFTVHTTVVRGYDDYRTYVRRGRDFGRDFADLAGESPPSSYGAVILRPQRAPGKAGGRRKTPPGGIVAPSRMSKLVGFLRTRWWAVAVGVASIEWTP